MIKKLLAKLKGANTEQEPPEQKQVTAMDEMNTFLDELKNIFAKELLIDPRIRDFEATTYGNSCRQRCNNIMERTTLLTAKIENHIEQHKELHQEKERFNKFINDMFSNLQNSSGKLNDILSQQDTEDKERQLTCYNLGMTVQQSTRTLIDNYIAAFNRNHEQKHKNPSQ